VNARDRRTKTDRLEESRDKSRKYMLRKKTEKDIERGIKEESIK
jgi:hypothetical protein